MKEQGSNLGTVSMSDYNLIVVVKDIDDLLCCFPDIFHLLFIGSPLTPLENSVSSQCNYNPLPHNATPINGLLGI